MKIGAFSKRNNITIDTIRHYMELGLILPEKKGGQYHFDNRCQQDINDILSFKNMGFTLNEIKTIFKYRKLGKFSSYQKDEYYRNLFTSKLKTLNEDLKALTQYKNNIELKLKEWKIADQEDQAHSLGIDLKTLDVLNCQHCSNQLDLTQGNVVNGQIISGKLTCPCGKTYTIDSGIFIDPTQTINDHNEQEYNRFLSEYIQLTDSSYIDNLNIGIEWGYKKLTSADLKGKILLELGTGLGFFLRNIYTDLPDDCLYIAVDHNIYRLRFVKELLERSKLSKRVLFICSDFLNIPIRNKVVDFLLDFTGTSNYSFENKEFLLNYTDKYVKDDSSLYGGYILFKHFNVNSLIEEKYRSNFILENIKASISQLNYQLKSEQQSDYIEKGGKYENYFVEGEKVYLYYYYGVRSLSDGLD